MIKAIIFDFDGVIADTEMAIFNTNKKIMDIFGKKSSMTFEEYRRQITNWKEMYKKIGFTEEELAKVPDIFLAEIMKMDKDIHIFDGVENLLRTLRKKFKMAIVSNGDKRRIKHQLDANNLTGCFDIIIDLTAEKHKPDPHQMIVCMNALDVSPQETCVIGDSTDDILAAKRAGVAKIIAVTYGYQPKEMLMGADVLVDTPQELLAILEAL